MFTQNYYNLFRAGFCKKGQTTIPFVNTSGISFNAYVDTSRNPPISNIVFFPLYGDLYGATNLGNRVIEVAFGTGTTPPTLGDYFLESLITSGLTITGTLTSSVNTDSATEHAIFSIANTSEEDISIGEIGLIADVAYSTVNYYDVLLDRTVLAEPITVPAGGSVTLDYILEFGLPVPPA